MSHMSGKTAFVTLGGDKNQMVLDGKLPPALSVTGVDNTDGTGTFTVQAQTVDGASLSGRFLLRVWRGAAAYGTVGDINGFAVATGTLLKAITANGDLEVITDTAGKATFTATDDGAHHVMATAGGTIYTGNVTVTSQ